MCLCQGVPMTASYLDLPLGDFSDLVAKREPAPGGGAVAAVTLSLAAGLVAMAARYSTHQLGDGERLVDEAERLRARAAGLADADADAYRAVIAAYQSARDGDSADRPDAIRDALQHAAEVPLEVAESGAETARIASRLVLQGKLDVRGDAATALLLAEAATRSAAHLVAVNVDSGGCGEKLLHRAQSCVASAQDALRGVQAALHPHPETEIGRPPAELR